MLLLTLFACGQPPQSNSAEQEGASDSSMNSSDTIRTILGDVHPINSLDALSYLKTLHASAPKNKDRRLLVYAQADPDWIKRTNIPALLDQMNSNERACCVMSVFSSHWVYEDEHATIGGHAMDIIDAYRFRTSYPPLKTCPFSDDARMVDIRKWWSEGGNTLKKETSL